MSMLAVLFVAIILSSVVMAGQDSFGPRLLKKVEPVCTAAALKAKIDEVVRVDVRINEHGEPSRLEVVESPGYGLGAKALETVSQWRFGSNHTTSKAKPNTLMPR